MNELSELISEIFARVWAFIYDGFSEKLANKKIKPAMDEAIKHIEDQK